jgi:cytochrome c oxidase subunit II
VSRTISRGTRSLRRSRALLAVVGLAGAAFVLSGCAAHDLPPMIGIEPPASVQGERMYSLWQGSWVAAWIVGGITWGLMIWAAIAYRRRSESPPPQTRYNLPIEALYTVLPLIVVAVLFAFTARDQSDILAVSSHPQNTINVVGFQWNWTFNYVDHDVYDVGSPQQLPTLYMPVGESVKFELTSPDVIHSFWVPAFLFKMDVIPGKVNVFQITATKTGTFAGRCAELCGVYHSRMLFQVKVVTPAEFSAHMQALAAMGQVGLLDTGRVITSATGRQGLTTIGGSP